MRWDMGIFNGSNDGSLLIGDYIRQHMEYGIINDYHNSSTGNPVLNQMGCSRRH